MGVKTQISIFHGNNIFNGKSYPTKINFISTQNNDVYNYVTTNINISDIVFNTIEPPIRFKLQDNDDQDLQFPLQIPQEDNVVYYSYRKQIKLQFIPDGIGDTIIQNLRVYVDTGKTDSSGNLIMDNGVIVNLKVDNEYTPQSILDVTQGLGDTQLNQLEYDKTNQLPLNTGVVFNTQENPLINIDTTDISTIYDTLSQRLFGNQPYLYLIVGLTKDQEQGIQSQFNIYYVYDEI